MTNLKRICQEVINTKEVCTPRDIRFGSINFRRYSHLATRYADKIAQASLVMEEALKFYRDEYNWLKGDSEVCSAIIADTGTRAKSAFAQVQEILK